VVVDFVARFPEHRLVLDHIGSPRSPNGARALGLLDPKLGKFENLYCKVSGW
jgi:predicted TIM-barrel fold metal-dependent hydrolase